MLDDQDKGFVYGLAGPSSAAALPLHPAVVPPFLELQHKAAPLGIDLQIASGFRSFDRQLLIWNRKATGELAVLGNHGEVLDFNNLQEREKVFSILRWSALPGASRHHWGTDLDVFDAASMPAGYRLQLTVEEARNLFGKLHGWLDAQITEGRGLGFFRPYDQDRGGIAPEPWHLSFAPLALEFQREFSLEVLAVLLAQTDIVLKATILDNLQEIYERFIDVPCASYPPEYR